MLDHKGRLVLIAGAGVFCAYNVFFALLPSDIPRGLLEDLWLWASAAAAVGYIVILAVRKTMRAMSMLLLFLIMVFGWAGLSYLFKVLSLFDV